MEKNTKIIISGAYGKMGQSLIKELKNFPKITCTYALIKNKISKKFKNHKNFNFPFLNLNQLNQKKTVDFDVLIDFSNPKSSLQNLEFCIKKKKNIVIGTTGFTNLQMKYIKESSKKISILYSPNFSCGINLMCILLEKISNVIGENSDIAILESHHKNKKDQPSGTALYLKSIITNTMKWKFQNKNISEYFYLNKKKNKKKIICSSLRLGNIIGKHTVIFENSQEILKITHKAVTRDIFSQGALKSAYWLKNKKNGFFTMRDVLI
ncbi:4-hydroxy-tetrahydrodipicolinate reductase [Buchnera aphidicola]|uniref:4-hydroxy-tetrahydrodipicolinate reductase n=1 Tax=Buchnera aphidicola TaxID=9 RepID=UPI0031B6A84E